MFSMNRRQFLVALSAPAWPASETRANPVKPPNIVVMVADDLGGGDMGAYGHPRIKTPCMDALAKESIRFTRAFLTTSSCSPSRASVLTGMYPHSTGAGELHLPVPAWNTLFTTPLRERGYWTAAAGKWHLGDAVRSQFDRIVGSGPSGAESWLKVIEERPRDRPFFLWLAAVDPHRPYAEGAIPVPHGPEDAVVPPFLPDTPSVRKDLALYYDEVARFDGNVGKVISALREAGVLENTVVIVFSDNGRPFPRCKTTLYDSGIATPLLVRLPGRRHGGAVSKALVSLVDLASTVTDLAGAAPLPATQGRSFSKVLDNPAREHRKYIFAEHNWHDYTARERAVRSTRFLYIRNDYPDLPRTPPADAVRSPTFRAMQQLYGEGALPAEQAGPFVRPAPREELYEVENDPYNLHNLAGHKEYLDVLNRLRATLDTWQRDTKDKAPAKQRPDGFDRVTGERLAPS